MSFQDIHKIATSQQIADYFSKERTLKEKAEYIKEVYGEGTVASAFAKEVQETLKSN